MRWRDTVVAAGIACIVTVVTAVPALDRLDGFSIDILFWLRHQVYGPVHEPETSPSVVIAIDEETYRRPPFEGIPKVMWTPHLASVLNEVLDAGAVVVGQDIILPTSVEKYIKGYDRDYLLALREGGRSGRLVLGKVQHLKPISPYPGHSFGGQPTQHSPGQSVPRQGWHCAPHPVAIPHQQRRWERADRTLDGAGTGRARGRWRARDQRERRDRP